MNHSPTDVSSTAQNMAAFRALESGRPVGERLFCDPFARRFLPRWQRALLTFVRVPSLRALIERYADDRAPGARTSAIARTRLIDDWLRDEVAAGARQVVLLGAGFDCRALRLTELSGIDVFEVDRPAMVAFKTGLLARETALARLHRVPVDFQRDDVARRLLDAGFAPATRTAFVWEGVTNYLDEQAVAAVFDFVARSAPRGSRILFTYVHADALDGRFDAPGLVPLLARLQRIGEPWTFGFRPDALPAFVARHGLQLLRDLSAADYRRLYWPSMPERGHGYEFYRVAVAESVHAAR
jgi:methyltransferase (TIGR00027 family)